MKAMVFDLKGKNAFFKKPDVNSSFYFTYSHIHKIALLGVLGSVIGLEGYQQQFEDRKKNGETDQNRFPQFYERLKELKVSVVPQCNKGYFGKKIQYFNNATAFANKTGGEPGTLQVREMWIDSPHWEIYLLLDGSIEAELEDRLVEYFTQSKSIYTPYLGKNDHPATILNPRLIELEKTNEEDLFIHSFFELGQGIEFSDEDEREYFHHEPYYFKEQMPVQMEEMNNYYQYKELVLTNANVFITDDVEVYTHEEKGLFFY